MFRGVFGLPPETRARSGVALEGTEQGIILCMSSKTRSWRQGECATSSKGEFELCLDEHCQVLCSLEPGAGLNPLQDWMSAAILSMRRRWTHQTPHAALADIPDCPVPSESPHLDDSVHARCGTTVLVNGKGGFEQSTFAGTWQAWEYPVDKEILRRHRCQAHGDRSGRAQPIYSQISMKR